MRVALGLASDQLAAGAQRAELGSSRAAAMHVHTESVHIVLSRMLRRRRMRVALGLRLASLLLGRNAR